jgi:hypothetical protein
VPGARTFRRLVPLVPRATRTPHSVHPQKGNYRRCRDARSERGCALRSLRSILAAMPRKPQQPRPPILWDIFISVGVGELGRAGMLVGTVEAADENEAIEKAPARLKQHGRKLMAVRRS